MGESYPKIENLQSLGDYANEILTFAETYTNAVNQTYRTYAHVPEENNGVAINAFLDKLNTLQSQVFDQFPLALETYGQTVASYQTTLTGLGFNQRMWSKMDGANDLSSRYTGSQVTKIEESVNSVKSALETAAKATGIEAPSLESIKTTAIDGFSAAASKRVAKASAVDAAWQSFRGTLSDNAQTIKSFQSVLNTVHYLSGVPVVDVITAIKNGDFTADEMWYIDSINSKEDAQILTAILVSPDKVAEIASSGHISDGMYEVIVDEISDWMEKGANLLQDKSLIDKRGYYEAKYNKFFEGLNGNSYYYNKDILTKLLEAGDRRAYLQTIAMMQLYDANPNNLNGEQMKNYQTRLYAYNNVLGLLNSAVYLEVGHKEWVDDHVSANNGTEHARWQRHDKHIEIKEFQFDNGKNSQNSGITFNCKGIQTDYLIESNIYGGTYPVDITHNTIDKTYTSQEVYTQAESQVVGDAKAYNDLQEQRKQALEDYKTKLVETIAKTGLSAIPIVGNSINMTVDTLQSLGKGKLDEVAKTGLSFVPDSIQRQSLKGIVDVTYDYVDYINKVAILNQEIENSKDKVVSGKNAYLDKGIWSLRASNNKIETYSTNYYYDFNAMLRKREMDSHGIVGYLESNKVDTGGKTVQQYIREQLMVDINSKGEEIDQDVLDYMMGSSGKTLSDFTPEQMNNFQDYIGYLGETGDNYIDYLADNYEYKWGY